MRKCLTFFLRLCASRCLLRVARLTLSSSALITGSFLFFIKPTCLINTLYTTQKSRLPASTFFGPYYFAIEPAYFVAARLDDSNSRPPQFLRVDLPLDRARAPHPSIASPRYFPPPRWLQTYPAPCRRPNSLPPARCSSKRETPSRTTSEPPWKTISTFYRPRRPWSPYQGLVQLRRRLPRPSSSHNCLAFPHWQRRPRPRLPHNRG